MHLAACIGLRPPPVDRFSYRRPANLDFYSFEIVALPLDGLAASLINVASGIVRLQVFIATRENGSIP